VLTVTITPLFITKLEISFPTTNPCQKRKSLNWVEAFPADTPSKKTLQTCHQSYSVLAITEERNA
jgi:hypothetical protein